MLSKIIIYAAANEIHSYAYNQQKQLEYYLVDKAESLNHAVFLAKIVNLYTKNGIAWVNYLGDKTGIINLAKDSCLQQGSSLLCQMTWEGSETKKAKFSSEIKLAGKYVVVLDNSGHHFARGLKDNQRLGIISQKYQHLGLIFRSAINNLGDLDFVRQEIDMLALRMNEVKQAKEEGSAPRLILAAIPKYIKLLHNLSYTEDFTVVTNSEAIFNRLNPCVNLWQIDQLKFDESIVVETILPQSGYSLADKTHLTLHKLSGINLIDIDSSDSNLSFYQLNYLAVDEIVRRIKLDDLYGIILVDFIKNMTLAEQKKIVDKLSLLLKDDWRRNKVLGFTAADICEIIRSK